MNHNFKKPTFEYYNLSPEAYSNYSNRLTELLKQSKAFYSRTNELLNFLAIPAFIFVIGGILSLFVDGAKRDKLALYFSIALPYLIFYYFYSKNRDKKKKIIENELSLIRSTVLPYEKSLVDYYTLSLKYIYHNNLYKKRSDNVAFQRSLHEFKTLLDEITDVKETLVSTNFNEVILNKYFSYWIERKSNHEWLKKEEIARDLISPSEDTQSGTSNVRLSIYKEMLEEMQAVTLAFVPPEEYYSSRRGVANWEAVNNRRQEVGNRGEQIVLALERDYLESIGEHNLAKKVRHVSREEDSLGYDILSYFEDGRKKYIEVKTSSCTITQFYISRNELSFLKIHPDESFVYFVYLSSIQPEIEILSCERVFSKEITPTQFVVKF